jgi:hypothetical protein
LLITLVDKYFKNTCNWFCVSYRFSLQILNILGEQNLGAKRIGSWSPDAYINNQQVLCHKLIKCPWNVLFITRAHMPALCARVHARIHTSNLSWQSRTNF